MVRTENGQDTYVTVGKYSVLITTCVRPKNLNIWTNVYTISTHKPTRADMRKHNKRVKELIHRHS